MFHRLLGISGKLDGIWRTELLNIRLFIFTLLMRENAHIFSINYFKKQENNKFRNK